MRDYGHDDQIGLEQTPDEYIGKLVRVFREVMRVLRDDGTLWLNLGDSYSTGSGGANGEKGSTLASSIEKCNPKFIKGNKKRKRLKTLKTKNLIGIPWRVAFALQADGWYLRQDIIWHKPNPLPESVTDRCTKAHEYIFLLSKSKKYYYDNDSIKEPTTTRDNIIRDRDLTRLNNTSGRSRMGGLKLNNYNKRNKRSVWTVTTKPFKGAHFAVFPSDLIEPCVLAGCPEGGIILDPFGGSGTVALVARRYRRYSILCELNKDYFDVAVERYKREVSQLRIGDLRT